MISSFKPMSSILKDSEGKRFKVQIFELTEDKVKIEKMRGIWDIDQYREVASLEAGKYAKLIDKEQHEIIMSDTNMEKETNHRFVTMAHGDILVAGLGIGLILLATQDKPEVTSILVLEKHQEVIDLVLPQLPVNSKINVICADVFEYQPQQKFDVIYFDIWSTVGSENWYDMKKLNKQYRKFLHLDKPDHWMDSWRRHDCQERAAEERASDREDTKMNELFKNLRESEEKIKEKMVSSNV